MSKGKEFISQLKLYSDYIKYSEELGRYNTWEETVDDVLETHVLKYKTKIQETNVILYVFFIVLVSTR